jgi:hypothetical protein
MTTFLYPTIYRSFIKAAFLLLGAFALTACSDDTVYGQNAAADAETALKLDVYKSPTCGCCQFWIDHAEEAGIESSIHHPEDLTLVKLQRGIDFQYHSCHTAVSEDGFVFEGHIPAKLIKQFLAETPTDAIGLAVPGMPIGSPGMEVGSQFAPYDVVLLHKDGSSSLYHRVETAAEQY